MLTLLRVVSITQICVALLELFAGGSMLFVLSGSVEDGGSPSRPLFGVGPGYYMLTMGTAIVAAAILRPLSGILGFTFRGYLLGPVSITLGLVSSLTLFCAPTSVICFILGLIAYLQAPVREAYAMRRRGESPRDIAAWLEGGGRGVDERVFD